MDILDTRKKIILYNRKYKLAVKKYKKTGNVGIFEELIDQMMIDEVAGMNGEIAYILKNLDGDKIRMAILSILDKDRNLFIKLKNIIDKNVLTPNNYVKAIVKMLREYVSVGDVEKKKFGEVMTPIPLVEEMLDKLPSKVWSNPNLKWLDPCNGVGIFPCVVVSRLMDGLCEWQPDEELRYKHIIENMLFVGELQHKNMFLFLFAFNPYKKYKMNIYTGSFLDEGFDNHMRDIWKLDKFNIIIGNPPYQLKKDGFKKSQPLWHLFIKKSIDILIEKGHMSMVHPSGWRNISGVFKKTQQLMLSNQFLYLEVHNVKDGLKTFGASTRYDFYCMEKIEPYKDTIIKTQNGSEVKIDISMMGYIPNGDFDIIKSLVANNEEVVTVLYSRSKYGSDKKNMFKTKNTEFKYPCVQNVNVKNELSCIWYSNTNENGHFGIPKVMFGRKTSGVYVDEHGEYASAQDVSSIVDDVENIHNIQKALLSDKFINLMKQCDFGGVTDRYNRKIIATFKKDFWKEFI
jgi:hypothetical protein